MTRLRSNALTGPNDPRFLAPTHLDLTIALNKTYAVDPSLTSFLRVVYGNRDIMAERTTGTLADDIYGLYGDSAGEPGPDITWKIALDFLDGIWRTVKNDHILKNGFFQNTEPRYTLGELAVLGESQKKAKIKEKHLLQDFLYFSVPNMPPAVTRCYANAKFSHVIPVLENLKRAVAHSSHSGICALKICGVLEIHSRADTFVIYCKSKERAISVGERLKKLIGHFEPTSPGMTTTLAPGISIGAEPIWQATGMGYIESDQLKGLDKERAQSFGSIRCQLIAMAIYNFNANKHLFTDNFETFQKFVAIAFVGYGLDPARPGD